MQRFIFISFKLFMLSIIAGCVTPPPLSLYQSGQILEMPIATDGVVVVSSNSAVDYMLCADALQAKGLHPIIDETCLRIRVKQVERKLRYYHVTQKEAGVSPDRYKPDIEACELTLNSLKKCIADKCISKNCRLDDAWTGDESAWSCSNYKIGSAADYLDAPQILIKSTHVGAMYKKSTGNYETKTATKRIVTCVYRGITLWTKIVDVGKFPTSYRGDYVVDHPGVVANENFEKLLSDIRVSEKY